MNFFKEERKIRGLAEPIPSDPNGEIVDGIYKSYPYGCEALGVRSSIRMIVYTVMEMKRRGLI